MWPELKGVALAARARPEPAACLPAPSGPGVLGSVGGGRRGHWRISTSAQLRSLLFGDERVFQPCFFKLRATLWPGASAVGAVMEDSWGAVMGRGTGRPGSARRGPQFWEGLTLTQAYGGSAAGEGWLF